MNENLKAMIAEHTEWPRHLTEREKTRFLAFALAGEAGELTGPLKKEWRGDPWKPEWDEMLCKELADVGNYAFMLAHHLGIDLLAEMEKKFAEVERRPEWINREKGE